MRVCVPPFEDVVAGNQQAEHGGIAGGAEQGTVVSITGQTHFLSPSFQARSQIPRLLEGVAAPVVGQVDAAQLIT
jgi:hypothetical protein